MADLDVKRAQARERMRRWRARHEKGVSPIGRSCTVCGCRLSRYNHDATCSACEPAYATHSDYMADHDPAAETIAFLTGENTCIRGHDLNEHGRYRNAGAGRRSRYCKVCDAQRAREKRARLRGV